MARAAVFLCLLLASLQLGCSRLEKEKTTPFLKPLDVGPTLERLGGKPNERKVCIETAKSVAEKGHFAEAILLFEKAEELEPKSKSLDLELAPLYAQNGQTEKAVRRYQQVIAKGTAGSEVYNNFAWTLIDANRYSEAELVISQGLSEYPGEERLRSARAILSYHLGNRSESLRQFRELYGPATAHHNVAILDLQEGMPENALSQVKLATQMPDCSKETFDLHDMLVDQLNIAKQRSNATTR